MASGGIIQTKKKTKSGEHDYTDKDLAHLNPQPSQATNESVESLNVVSRHFVLLKIYPKNNLICRCYVYDTAHFIRGKPTWF